MPNAGDRMNDFVASDVKQVTIESLRPVRGDRVMFWINGAAQLGSVIRVMDDTAEIATGLTLEGAIIKRPIAEVAFVDQATFPPAPFNDVPSDAADYLDLPSPKYHTE